MNGDIYTEGYDAYYAGLLLIDCPYAKVNEIVETEETFKFRLSRHDWLLGWQVAFQEDCEEIDEMSKLRE